LFTLEGWFGTIRVLEAVMEPDMLPPAVAVSCAEMIRTGTTCFADQYFWMDRIVPVVRQSGLRAALAYGIVELGDPAARERELAAAASLLASLGTDNVTNNNSYDLFKEMQILGKLMSLHERTPNAIPTRKIIEMATQGGAR